MSSGADENHDRRWETCPCDECTNFRATHVLGHFLGWRRNEFVFRTADGFKTALSGPRAAVERQLRKLLPAWRGVAEEKGDVELVGLIDRELLALTLSTSRLRADRRGARAPAGCEAARERPWLTP